MARLSLLLGSSLFSFFITLTVASSAVLDLIPDNFDKVVLKSGKPALVEFFAPWCGHCRNLAPVYEELGQAFSFASDKVSIAKVDADENRDLGKRFNVQGFPTLKWFDGKSDEPVDYAGGRDLESLAAFVTEKTGVKPKAPKEAPSAVQMLTDQSFGQVAGEDKHLFVAFTAPWCGHCKSLAPIWEALANDFLREEDVVIAKVNAEAENSRALAREQGVTSYPTIKFFPKGAGLEGAIPYDGARSEADLVKYVNEQTGARREVGGGLNEEGGRIVALDNIVAKHVSTQDFEKLFAETKSAAGSLTGKYAQYYVRAAEKMTVDTGYANKEAERLKKILSKGGIVPEKADDLVSRRNILQLFAGEDKEASPHKDEL